MYRNPNPTSGLDDLATAFLESHGARIPAEPGSQTFRWQRWSNAPKRAAPIYVPVASFLDIPRKPRLLHLRDARACAECGDRCGGLRCERCRRRKVRADFIAGCARRQGDATAIFEAMITQAAWEGSPEDGTLQRVVVAHDFREDEEIRSDLVEAFASAMEANAEPEVFRGLIEDAGFGQIIAERDARALEKERNRAARAADRRSEVSTPPPLLIMRPADARRQAAELIGNPRFLGGRRLATRMPWGRSDYVALQIMLRARVEPEVAASAIGRSPTSMAWRAHEVGLHLPRQWRALLKGSIDA